MVVTPRLSLALIRDVLFGCDTEIVAKRVADVGSDRRDLLVTQAAERWHVVAAVNDLENDRSDGSQTRIPGERRRCVLCRWLTLTIGSVASVAIAAVDRCTLVHQSRQQGRVGLGIGRRLAVGYRSERDNREGCCAEGCNRFHAR